MQRQQSTPSTKAVLKVQNVPVADSQLEVSGLNWWQKKAAMNVLLPKKWLDNKKEKVHKKHSSLAKKLIDAIDYELGVLPLTVNMC